jgi:hypothetical protein
MAKKLGSIIVTNSDIKNELLKSGRKFDESKSFNEREQHFRIIFNKLASRQLFEEMQSTQKAIDYYSDVIIDSLRSFPPYVNEIFKMYPHDETSLLVADPSLTGKLADVDNQIAEKEHKIIDGTTTAETKMRLREDIGKLKEGREKMRWEAYIKFLNGKDKQLADVMNILVENKFNFGSLHA